MAVDVVCPGPLPVNPDERRSAHVAASLSSGRDWWLLLTTARQTAVRVALSETLAFAEPRKMGHAATASCADWYTTQIAKHTSHSFSRGCIGVCADCLSQTLIAQSIFCRGMFWVGGTLAQAAPGSQPFESPACGWAGVCFSCGSLVLSADQVLQGRRAKSHRGHKVGGWVSDSGVSREKRGDCPCAKSSLSSYKASKRASNGAAISMTQAGLARSDVNTQSDNLFGQN